MLDNLGPLYTPQYSRLGLHPRSCSALMPGNLRAYKVDAITSQKICDRRHADDDVSTLESHLVISSSSMMSKARLLRDLCLSSVLLTRSPASLRTSEDFCDTERVAFAEYRHALWEGH